ncbi:putative late blight resistance protein R1A-10 [Salvia divinorum]|uniref:Late blight resistance protein R1A-10 n=1 Tax=Salvia divinorum TaxID=28513 RepID=A0ABD1G1J4_SALDI
MEMAMAYACLVSLLNTMDQIQTHPLLSTCFDNYQFQSLREIVDFLVDFVENYSEEAEDLMGPIGDAAHEAEDMIEIEAADRIRGESTTKSVKMFLRRLEKMIQGINSIKVKVIKYKEEIGSIISMPPPSSSSSSSSPATKKTSMLGFDGYVTQLLDELIGHDSRRILPIVGMGGIGKTTLAKNVYENSLAVYHFDVRAWVTVSQEYNATHMLSQALSFLGGSMNKADDELGEALHKTLSCRRYLIVLDDVWSVVAWEKIQNFFPENGNGSRIVVTTRQQEVVDYFGSSSLAVGFLDYQNSWDLFCEVAFAEENCPLQLEGIAEKVVRRCNGLPLAIRVIGGLLGKAPRTREYWEDIAKDKSLVMEYSDEGNKPSSILYMSYKHLPVWLKSCFLYLGLFPEDHKVYMSLLTKLWVAEGFIKPTKNRSLEQIAESYMKELVDRNLLLVGELTINKKILYCSLHDLVRELCIKTAEKENFYWVQRDIGGRRRSIFDERWESFYTGQSFTLSEKPSPLVPFKCRLLRVLVDDKNSLDNPFQQVNLRYITQGNYRTRPAIPSSISLCWSLQTLIVHPGSTVVLPSEIWDMPQLRHIEISKMKISDPPLGDVCVLHNLQTLKTVEKLVFTEDVCARVANIRELDIIYYSSDQRVELGWSFHLHNVGRLSKLESLSMCCMGEQCVGHPLENLRLPNSLRELMLDDCYVAWSGMEMIASLPRLQILRLLGKVAGLEWKFVKEEFRCLKHLFIYNCDLVSWNADRSNFPVLETLLLSNLQMLDEIPLDIGEIPTLEQIAIFDCSESTRLSAIKIQEEQESLGNQALQVLIDSFDSPNFHFF